jgi:hypothetical protein
MDIHVGHGHTAGTWRIDMNIDMDNYIDMNIDIKIEMGPDMDMGMDTDKKLTWTSLLLDGQIR